MPRQKNGYDLLSIYLEPSLRVRIKHAALDAGCSISDFVTRHMAASLGVVVPTSHPERPKLVVSARTEPQSTQGARNCLECRTSFVPPPKGARAVYCGDNCRKKAHRERRKSA